jgi:serpin B
LWLQTGYNFLKDFLELTEEYYDAGLNHVDFAKDSEAACNKINIWVEQKTNNRIQKLIKPSMINALTRLVLTNAIYFKGNWVSQFEESSTQDTLFYITPDTTVSVPLMHQNHEFKYWKNDTLQILELPYAGDDLSMLILLPRKVDGLANLENLLTMENLNQWIKDLKEYQVMVYLPKLRTSCEFRLDTTLIAMGMPDAFKPNKADFSGITDPPLWISAVVHKAFVDVSEEGTEAAAATAVIMVFEEEVSVQPLLPPVVFRADHPFIFMIRDNHSGSILFIGKVVDPSK